MSLRTFLAVACIMLSPETAFPGGKPDRPSHPHGGDGPVAAFLAPDSGARVRPEAVAVRAVVASREWDPRSSFLIDGRRVDGRNAGRLDRVRIAVDQVVVADVDATTCREQLVVDQRLDLAAFTDGGHVLTLTAYQADGHRHVQATITRAFVIDRSLPVAVPNRVEAAATPVPFACFTVDRGDHGRRSAKRPVQLRGRFVPGAHSDGVDVGRDRIVLGAGTRSQLIEAGALQCNRRERVCRFVDDASPLVRRLTLHRQGEAWRFELVAGPDWPAESAFHLRVGNDIGGVDLASGETLIGMRPETDDSRRAEANLGVAGGTFETVDRDGIVIRLDVPPGALAGDTLLSMTPLTASPIAGDHDVHPGVELEPHGLQFAVPVSLTYDFGGRPIPPAARLFYVTSALTKLPLGGELNGSFLTASLWHFSIEQPGVSATSLADRVAWANAVLLSPLPLTVLEMQSLLAIVADQQLAGCTFDCVDLNAVATRIEQSVAATVAAECANPAASASKAAIIRLLSLEAIVQQVGGAATGVLPCVDAMLGALIAQIIGPPQSTAPDDPVLADAKELAELSRQSNLPARAAAAYQKLAQGIRAVVDTAVATAQAAFGTPDEDAIIEQSRAQIQLGQTWATTIAPEMLAVDDGLPAFLQDALASLDGGVMTVQLLEGHIGCRRPSEEVPGAHLPIPPLDTTVRNRLEWSVELGEPCASAEFTADFTFSSAGVLTLTADPAWFPEPVEGYPYSFNGGSLSVQSTTAQLLCHRTAIWVGCAFGTAAEVTVDVEAGTHRLRIWAVYMNTSTSMGAQTATGRVLSISFSPRP